jgi:hypothetical protein
VAPAADRDLETGAGGELQRSGDVVGDARPDDHRRTAVVEAVVAAPGVVVAGIAGEEDLPVQPTGQPAQGVAHPRFTPR